MAWTKIGRKLPDFYDHVAKDAVVLSGTSKYKKALVYSLGLDNFSSQVELFRFVDKKLWKKLLSKKLLSPLRLTKKILKRIFIWQNFPQG
jgi:hypothetical protein